MFKFFKQLLHPRRSNVHPEYFTVGEHLIRCAKQLGYDVNPAGVCEGLSCMAMQAILANNLDAFNQRISLMMTTAPEDFKQKIENLEYKKLGKHHFTKKETLLADARMFFDGLVAYQKGGKFLKTLGISADINQNPLDIAPITWPTILDTEEQSLIKIGQFSGVYMDEQADSSSEYLADEHEVARYLTFLRDAIKVISPSLSQPIVLHLSVPTHKICISYDTNKDKWAFIDVKAYPQHSKPMAVTFCSDISQMAALIHYTLSESSNLKPIFSTTMYGLKKHSTQLTSIFNDWKQHMNDMLTVSKKKAHAYGANVSTWLMVAALNGEEDVVKALLSHGIDVNDKGALRTSIEFAIQHDHERIVEILLNHGADVNTKVGPDNTMSALDFAIILGRAAIANILLDHGASVSETTEHFINYLAINEYPDKAQEYNLLLSKIEEKTTSYRR